MKIIKFFIALCTFIILSALLVYFFKGIFIPSTFILCADYRYHPTIIEHIKKYLTHKVLVKKNQLINVLQKEIPFEKGSLHYYANSTVTITLHAPHLYAQIVMPDKSISLLTSKKTLEPSRYFKPEYYEYLPRLTLKNSIDSTISDFYHFVREIPSYFFDNYDIALINQYSIIFKHKQLPIVLISNYQTIFNESLSKKIDYILAYIHNQKKKIIWAVDLRFNNQIIIGPYKEENYEENIK